MRKIMMTLVAAFACTVAAMAQDVEFKVSGVVPQGTVKAMVGEYGRGKTIYTDSVCAGGKFAIAGKAPKDAIVAVAHSTIPRTSTKALPSTSVLPHSGFI